MNILRPVWEFGVRVSSDIFFLFLLLLPLRLPSYALFNS